MKEYIEFFENNYKIICEILNTSNNIIIIRKIYYKNIKKFNSIFFILKYFNKFLINFFL